MKIKLRFWDTEDKVMVDWLAVMQTAFNCDMEGTGLLYRLMSNPRYEKLLFTGLKDKNGNEIYEGDIVNAASQGVKAKCTVKWGQGRAGFFLHAPSICWNLSGGGVDYTEESVEVIGNIYSQEAITA